MSFHDPRYKTKINIEAHNLVNKLADKGLTILEARMILDCANTLLVTAVEFNGTVGLEKIVRVEGESDAA